jgi:F-type H+-transporting ATPase subunit b
MPTIWPTPSSRACSAGPPSNKQGSEVHTTFLTACELKRKVPPSLGTIGELRRGKLVSALLFAMAIAFAAPAFAQEHAPAAQPAGEHAAEAEHAEGGHDQSIGGMIMGMGWPIANFIIFCGVIYYFGNGPLKEYLATRSASIRKDLVEAAELKATATAQLATIEQKLQALPGELNALRTRGAEEIAAEEKRIAAAAEADRERLLEQTRREIDLQVRLAKKDILEHAADLSVQLAGERLKNEITPADQSRLVDQYLTQVKDRQ